ncbi:MAG: WecB/TagA/CpsF family glycosyltransferase, partial [Candidatus Dormiibacterota bacterium]
LLEAACELALPPLGLLGMALVLGFAVSAGLALLHLAAPIAPLLWAAAIAAVALYVVVGLWAARADAATYRALLAAPFFVLRKALVYAGLRRFDPARWDRTERTASPQPAIEVAGVPVHDVRIGEAARRLVARSLARPATQACTVNLDFLVQAHRDDEVRDLLQASVLNVADGTPVLWLARLGGRRLPERVAGVDLVPQLAKECAARDAKLFLLGGQDGAAAEAAEHLRELAPGLRVTTLEPPAAPLGGMDDRAILDVITDNGADVLLVAFGHPKQELWISRNLHRLPAGVAIGVGGSLDLLVGRMPRAPRWMQRSGLEWFWRFSCEPRRLARRYFLDGAWLLRTLPVTLFTRLGA